MLSAKQYLSEGKRLVDEAIAEYLPKEDTFPESIHQSMKYSVFAGGKRLRPVLVMAAAEAVGGNRHVVLPFAVAAEFIHTYSLIHDDLPALDDDNFRRGKPTNHKVFGEAIAILAGDGLLTQAFILMTDSKQMNGVPRECVLKAVHEMACALGSTGMIGGQVVDIESHKSLVDAATLDYIHIYKTGSLILSCIRCGAILSQASEIELDLLSRYGKHIGLAFQIVDDILDITGDKEALGKDIGSDIDKGKATYPALYGLQKSNQKAEELVEKAIISLRKFGERANPLREIARFFLERTF